MNSGGASHEPWEEIEPGKALVDNAIHLASRDLRTAEHVLNGGDYDWSLAISYNAMLQAGRALMFSEGIRPKGESRHLAVIGFVKARFGKSFPKRCLYMFNKLRKKRHTAVYEHINIISKAEAENALVTSQEFVGKVHTLLYPGKKSW